MESLDGSEAMMSFLGRDFHMTLHHRYYVCLTSHWPEVIHSISESVGRGIYKCLDPERPDSLETIIGKKKKKRTSLVAWAVKNLPAMWETQVQSLGQEDHLEKGMATHSSILAWRISWTEEPGGLQSMGS